jgi:cytidyltransferase-like protein
MSTTKVKSIDSIASIVSQHNASNLTIGLISGCFDILHIGHIHLFQFAKSNVNTLVVGVDDDKSIKKTKGEHRPINNQIERMELLSHVSLVDYIFPLEFKGEFGDMESTSFWRDIYKKIQPSLVISSTRTDNYVESKESIVSALGIGFLPFNGLIDKSTTAIEKMLRMNVRG